LGASGSLFFTLYHSADSGPDGNDLADARPPGYQLDPLASTATRDGQIVVETPGILDQHDA
jgi:hypothetical protein